MGRGLRLPETVETEGTGAPAARSRPAPARMERVHGAGAGHGAVVACSDPHIFRESPNVRCMRVLGRYRPGTWFTELTGDMVDSFAQDGG